MSKNKKAVIFLADGFEDMEAIAPIDILLRGGIEVLKVGVNSLVATSSHNIKVVAEITGEEFYNQYIEANNIEQISSIILPGGLGGANNLASSQVVSCTLKAAQNQNIIIAAICAAPALVLSPLDILDNHAATCYPGFETKFSASTNYINNADVVVSANLVTAPGPGAAFAFGSTLLEILTSKENAETVCKAALINTNFIVHRA